MLAAVSAAKDQFGGPPQPDRSGPDQAGRRRTGEREQVDASPPYGNADAILDVARSFLAAAPRDRSGEDRTLVVLHVAAEQLAAGSAPAAAPAGAAAGGDVPGSDVPAGTPDATCHVQGVGGSSLRRRPEWPATPTWWRPWSGPGEVLALGRSRRLVSRGQRRALMIRDGMCQFPGCHQLRHLDAHHVLAWSRAVRPTWTT